MLVTKICKVVRNNEKLYDQIRKKNDTVAAKEGKTYEPGGF